MPQIHLRVCTSTPGRYLLAGVCAGLFALEILATVAMRALLVLFMLYLYSLENIHTVFFGGMEYAYNASASSSSTLSGPSDMSSTPFRKASVASEISL